MMTSETDSRATQGCTERERHVTKKKKHEAFPPWFAPLLPNCGVKSFAHCISENASTDCGPAQFLDTCHAMEVFLFLRWAAMRINERLMHAHVMHVCLERMANRLLPNYITRFYTVICLIY